MQSANVAEIDLSAIRDNVRAIRARVGPRVKIMPAVKAGAYGHGAIEVSLECLAAGADALGVASVGEAIELRDAGIEAGILILGCQSADVAAEIVGYDVSSTACDILFARALSAEAVRQNKTASVHIKVDTGMGRIGVAPDEAVAFARELASLPNLHIRGVFTHFTASEEASGEYTQMQIGTFKKAVTGLQRVGIGNLLAHASNSAGILAYPEAHFEAVRPGIMLYGYYPSDHVPRSVAVREALTLRTRIVFVKHADRGTPISYGRTHSLKRSSVVATLPIGYEDGYPRSLSNVGEVAVRGMRAPVLGRVCMDQTMVDVTDVPGVEVGDEVVVYGGGYDYLSVSRIARSIGTIPHEILCGIGKRVAKIYTGGTSD